jgi:hypothetical protein
MCQRAGRFLGPAEGGRSHSDTVVGSRVRSTTATSSEVRASRSICSRSRMLNRSRTGGAPPRASSGRRRQDGSHTLGVSSLVGLVLANLPGVATWP